MEHKYLETDEIESVVAKRFEQFENGLTLTDYKNKTLNLKLRAQPNQRGNQSHDASQPSELEQMKLEMVREMRQMREDLKNAMQSNQDCMKQLTEIQTKASNGQNTGNNLSN